MGFKCSGFRHRNSSVWPGCFFFLLWPLFARSPRHWFLENFLLSAPGVQSVFVALRWAPRPFGGARAKKKKHPGCFFFAPAPRLFGGAGAKKKTPWVVFFFLLRPRADAHSLTAGLGGDASPSPGWCFFFCCGPARTGVVFFFLLWPRAGAQRGFSFPCLSPGPEQKKKKTRWVVFFFCSGPVPAPNGASPSLAFRRGRSKKKKNTLGGVFFLLWPRAGAQRGFSFPCLSPGPQQKKNTLGGVFFFAAAPRGRSLTHCGPGWRCLPLAGVVFFFFCCGPARTGVVFFFLLRPRPDAHSLTVGWGDFGKARVVFFFLLRPRRVFLDNNKKCLGYYIGSKKTRRGHSKKKNTTSPQSFRCRC